MAGSGGCHSLCPQHSGVPRPTPGKGLCQNPGSMFCSASFEHVQCLCAECIIVTVRSFWSPEDSDSKESAQNVGDLGLIPGWGRSPGGGNDTHSSILAWRIPWTEEPGLATVLGIAESDTTEQLTL